MEATQSITFQLNTVRIVKLFVVAKLELPTKKTKQHPRSFGNRLSTNGATTSLEENDEDNKLIAHHLMMQHPSTA